MPTVNLEHESKEIEEKPTGVGRCLCRWRGLEQSRGLLTMHITSFGRELYNVCGLTSFSSQFQLHSGVQQLCLILAEAVVVVVVGSQETMPFAGGISLNSLHTSTLTQ